MVTPAVTLAVGAFDVLSCGFFVGTMWSYFRGVRTLNKGDHEGLASIASLTWQ